MHKVLSEEEMRKGVRNAKIVNYTVLAILMALLVAIVVGYYQHTFSSDRWLDEPSQRTKMIDDLLEHYDLTGLPETEILSLLGSHNNDYGSFYAENRYVYYLGPERSLFSIDSEWLLIDFTDGVVSEYSLARD